MDRFLIYNKVISTSVIKELKREAFVRSILAKVRGLTFVYGFSKNFSQKANFPCSMKEIFFAYLAFWIPVVQCSAALFLDFHKALSLKPPFLLTAFTANQQLLLFKLSDIDYSKHVF